ncbi:hypothetical protein [Lentilitoribacter sp. EG35]|uniref:hypothetical protein n=1 Tax=Lentilitoribacter sp. EG35 TaxID=3234192 RepID=UPI00345FB5E3
MTATNNKNRNMRIVIGVNVFICFVVLVIPILMPKSEKVAVILPPWSEPSKIIQVIADAGGALVNGGRLDWIAVTTSESDDFVSKLYQAGAVIVIDGYIAAACL